MALVSHHDISLSIVLDEQRPFFPGDSICGKVVLACSRSISPHGLRLIWAGGVTIRPTPHEQESYLYFKRTYAILNDKLKGKRVGKVWTYKSSAFVENNGTSVPLLLELKKGATYSFAFNIQVPVDIPLPSSTEAENSMLGGNIMYTLECCMDLVKNDPTPTHSHVVVTVLERMDVSLPELNVPRKVESAYSLWLTGTPMTNPCDYRTAMFVTLPCQASTRGGQINIDIHVWHSVEYQRPKGVTVRLLRVRQLHYHGCAYAFPDENVLSMRADIDLIEENKYMQTFRCALPISEDLTPSISDTAKLLEISYKVYIKVQLQEGVYQSLNGESHRFMSVEIPILIGTLPLIMGNKTISHPKGLASRKGTSDSKQSVGSNDYESGSVNSAELYKKSSSSDDGSKGRKATKQESSIERKNDSFWNSIRLPGIKRKPQKEDSAVNSFCSSPSSNTIDDELTQHHSSLSSHHESSQSASSPRTEVDILSTQLQKLYEPNDTPISQPIQITRSTIELKPDTKDYDAFPTTKTGSVLPMNNLRTINTIDENRKGIEQQSSEKEKNTDRPTNARRSPSAGGRQATQKGGRATRVRVVNIFVSSDEEDGDDEIQYSNTTQYQQGADNRKSYQWITGPTPSRVVSHCEPPSSQVPQHYTEYDADEYSDSDESDNTPLSLVSRQTR